MNISADSAVSSAVQAKASTQNSQIAVALAAKQLDAQKAAGNAIADLLASIRPAAGTPGHHVNVRV